MNINKITAVIPVKKNSSRLPGKNILPFGDSTLLEHKISQLKKVQGISKIIVSSDSEEMLDKALSMGVEAIKRPLNLADESRPLSEFFDYICTLIKEGQVSFNFSKNTSPTVLTSESFKDALFLIMQMRA